MVSQSEDYLKALTPTLSTGEGVYEVS